MREPAAREPYSNVAGGREPPPRETAAPDAIAEAARRLDRAMTRLEATVGDGLRGPDLFDPVNAALAAELAIAQAREQALTAAAQAASQALGRAADEVRLVLSGGDTTGDGIEDDNMTVDPAAPDVRPDATETMADPDPTTRPKDPTP